MAVALRLMRFGKKGHPAYRIVVLDKRQKRDGAYIEKVGTYNPLTDPATIQMDEERLGYWLKVGAVVSEGMRKILKKRQPKDVTATKKLSTKKADKKLASKTVKAPTKKTVSKEIAVKPQAPTPAKASAETIKLA